MAYDRGDCNCRRSLHHCGDLFHTVETILPGTRPVLRDRGVCGGGNRSGGVSHASGVADQALFERTNLPSAYLTILWKALGICYLTGIAGDLCQDCGESALARTVELWGRLSLVLLSLPLLETLLQMVTEVLS